MSLTALAEGIFLKVAAAVFVAGLALRLLPLLWRRGGGPHSPARKSPALGAAVSSLSWAVPKPGYLHRNPVRTAAALAFHVAFFGVVLFDPYHVVYIWEELLGVSWEPVSEELAGILSVVMFLALGVLLAGRLFQPSLRALTTFGDLFTISLVE